MVFCHYMNAGSVVGYHEVVGTLKPYLMQKNLFECFALTGAGTQKTLDTSVRAIACARASL